MSKCFNCAPNSKCACVCTYMGACTCEHVYSHVCSCVGESGALAEREQMLKMLSHHVLARDTWPELAKLLRDEPQLKHWK